MQDYARSPLSFPIRARGTGKPSVGTQIDWRHPLAQGLEACWLFHEGSGERIYDLTGNQHHIQITHDSGPLAAVRGRWVGGRWHGPALDFLPSTELVQKNPPTPGNILVSLRSPLLSPRTVEFWINPQFNSAGQGLLQATILGARGVFLNNNTATTFRLAYNGASPGGNFDAGVFEYGRWHHVVFTLAPISSTHLRVTLYVNGGVIGEGTLLEESVEDLVLFGTFATISAPYVGLVDVSRFWRRSLALDDVLALYTQPFAMFQTQPTLFVSRRPPHPPAQVQWRPQAVVIPKHVLPQPARQAWAPQDVRLVGVLQHPQPAVMRWRTNLFHRALTIEPTRLKWRAQTQILPVGLFLRDCGDEYEAALQKTTIGGDWLIAAPALGLFQSLNYEAGGSYEHRILDISDIEISAPPGGGICSGANVTITLAETGTGQSIIALWEQASAVEAVTVTIDFLLAGAGHVLRIFTGSIDSIVVKDAVAQILLVDDSIHHNMVIPKELVTVEAFPQADTAALTKAMPMIYGQGAMLGAAPLLFIDVPNNAYLLAGHPMRLGGKLAVYDDPNQIFLTLDTVVFIPNHGTGTITLGTIGAGLRVNSDVTLGLQGTNAIDGNSATLTVVPTNIPGPNNDFDILTGTGYGYAGWAPSGPGGPHAGTFQVDIWNHRRSPGSDPTTTGTFWMRTTDPENTVQVRQLYRSPKFRHVTSAQHDVFILSNVNIGVNELFQIVLMAECEGQVGTVWQTYEVGEVSLTPLFSVSANISGLATAVALPINLQDLRFNRVSPVLSYYTASFVTNVTNAIDGNSLTTAAVRTIGLDSNLDGYGQAIWTTSVTSALRANNTVVIDLLNHRRGTGAAPTVTGTFSIQTYNTATGVLLRDNLFVTQAFRHQTNPISTSYVATAINMGATAQLAVRLVARNEGGSGAAVDWYEVGEVAVESFYQPSGDSGELYLYGPGYEGRTDRTGTVLTYLGTTPDYLYQTPDEVLASLYVEEMLLGIDLPSFATAHNWYASVALGGQTFRFDGGMGAGWALEQANGRDILDAMAKQATAILFPTFEATWGLRPFRTDTDIHQHFDSSTILMEEGAEGQRPEDRTSTVQLTLGNLQNVFNHFEVRYRYNTGSRKYDAVYKVTKDGSNLPAAALDKAAIEASCYTSWLRYGSLEPMIVEANWIADDVTAAYYLRHLVFYFAQQRIQVQFETTMKAGCLQVGDFVTITDASLPAGDNGATYEVHTIRYRPLKGRVQLVCSRVSTIPDVPIPVDPAVPTGCERFEDYPGLIECWDFEELSGDRIGDLHETVLTPVNTPLGAPGKLGNAIQFRRAALQYLDAGAALSGVFTGEFTFACWIRLRSVPTDWGAFICNDSQTLGYPYREIFAGVASGGAVHVGVGYANTGGNLFTASPLPFTNTEADWTLIRIWRTWDASFGGVLGLQINNDPYQTVAFAATVPQAQNSCLLGAGYGLGGAVVYYGDFDMDQLLIWRRVLNDDEWDALWNGGLG